MRQQYEQESLLGGLFNEKDNKMGMRLERMEIYNWGAYDGYSAIPLARYSALISGDSGSGKSTILDAMVTLLRPPKITYNRAAEQSSNRDRSLAKYVLGQYAIHQNQAGREENARLRDYDGTRSIILAVFSDTFGNVVTLAQVFYFRGTELQTIFITSESRLSILRDFDGCPEIQDLRKKLRMNTDTRIYPKRKNYCDALCKYLGIRQESALSLWQNAAFMKSIGDIDSFIKDNMLESEDMMDAAGRVYHTFAELTEMKKTIRNLLNKQKLLEEVVDKGEHFAEAEKNREETSRRMGLVRAWQHICEAEDAREARGRAVSRLKDNKREQESVGNEAKATEDALRQVEQELRDKGADSIEQIERQIHTLDRKIAERETARETFDAAVSVLGVSAPQSERDFRQFRENLPARRTQLEEEKTSLADASHPLFEARKAKREELKKTRDDIRELERHPSNIDAEYRKMRNAICNALNLTETRLPFAGELMEFREDASAWRGAAERLLHNLSITLIVDESLYEKVSTYVNQHTFRNRLVYYRVKPSSLVMTAEKTDNQKHVYDLLHLKEDSLYAQWLSDILHTRYNHVCTESLDEFRKEGFALTKTGQIRSGNRHEKFDRLAIDDPNAYSIGFHGSERLLRNKQRAAVLEEEVADAEDAYKNCMDQQKENEERIRAVITLSDRRYNSYEQIDVHTLREERERQYRELKQIREEKGEAIRVLDAKRKRLLEQQGVLEDRLHQLSRTSGQLEERIHGLEEQVQRGEEAKSISIAQNVAPEVLLDYMEEVFRYSNNPKKNIISLSDPKRWEAKADIVSEELKTRFKRYSDSSGGLKNAFENKASAFISQYPEHASLLGTDVASRGSFRALLDEMREEGRMKLVRERATDLQDSPFRLASDAIASLIAKITDYRDRCREKMEILNDTIGSFPFRDTNHYIRIQFQDPNDPAISDFYRQCQDLSATLLRYRTQGDEEALGEEEMDRRLREKEKFIERFRMGSEADVRYIRRMTDARNWLRFSCIIVNRRTGEKEVIHGSGPKSGGELEILAYTVLAAGLKYSFNLSDDAEVHARSFRLLFVDEAFLKSSKDIQDTVLNLFRSLHLQAIMITPSSDVSTYQSAVDRFVRTTSDKDSHISQLVTYHIIKGSNEMHLIEEEEDT